MKAYTPNTRRRSGRDSSFKSLAALFGLLRLIATAAFLIPPVLLYSCAGTQSTPKIGYSLSVPELTRFNEDGTKLIDGITIKYNGSAARLEAIGKPVANGIRIEPDIKGEWRWTDDSTLAFTPREDWGVAQSYVVTTDKTLFADHVELESYVYKFNSGSFNVTLGDKEFHQNPVDQNDKRVAVTVRFTHPVNAKEFEKKIKMSVYETQKAEGKTNKVVIADSYPYAVTYNKTKTEAYVVSSNLPIPMRERQMEVTIDPGASAAAGGEPYKKEYKLAVAIPGMYTYFRINNAEPTLVRNDRFEPEQVIVISATNGIRETELQNNISAYILPRDLPEIPGKTKGIQKNYYWSDTSDIGPEVLKLAAPLTLTPIPTESEYSQMHSFRYEAAPGAYIYINIKNGLKSYGGYVLADEYRRVARASVFPKEISIMQEGAILSLNGEKKLSMLARGIKGVKFEVGQVLEGDVNHLVSQTYGDFKTPTFSNSYAFNDDNVSERYAEQRRLADVGPAKAQYFSFDFEKYLRRTGNRGIFLFSAEGWDPDSGQITGEKVKRLILVTDLGVVVKTAADQSKDVFVMSFNSGEPVAGAAIDVLGKNGVSIASRTTDAAGHAVFPNLSTFTREKTPTVYVVKKGPDMSFLPYVERSDRAINYSRFDVGGVYTEGKADALNAYLFSDRGIYRPGDKFNIGVIVKAGDWSRDVGGVPLEAVVTDPRGMTVKRERFALSKAGFEEISYKTEEDSPTGNYETSIYIVKDKRAQSLLGSTTVRVEEFMPDKMRISTRFSKDALQGWVSPDGISGVVELKNLFGTPATGRAVKAEIQLSPAYIAFRDYKDYRFFDPLKAKNSFTEKLNDRTTNDEGAAEFPIDLSKFEKATYNLRFIAQGFEAGGGRGVTSVSQIMVSPLEYLIGYKADGDMAFIHKNSARSIHIIAVNKALRKMEVSGLKARVLEGKYVSTLVKDGGVYRYKSVYKEAFVSEAPLKVADTGTAFALPTQRPGDFALVIEDSTGTELARTAFSVTGKANITQNLEKNAELQIKLDKKDYASGEKIAVSIKAPYTGAGLITIERERVYAYKWFKTSTTSAVVNIDAPAGVDGNAYVNVSFVRSIGSDEIFMSPLSYGVAPFTISLDKRDMHVNVDAPELARPGEPFRIKFKSSRPGKAIIFAIDEGILQVAGYKTPDPLGHYFQKKALEVRTSQILDLLLPEFKTVMSVAAPGGDEDKSLLGKNLNPFKRKRELPAAYWSGIVDIGAGWNEAVYDVPAYFNGTLRVMAVAVAQEAVGATEKKSVVKGHFVIQPNVPTFVAPGDVFDVSVNLANNVEGSGKDAEITLDLKATEQIEPLDGTSRKLKINEGREQTATFRVKATTTLGNATLVFTASLGNKSAGYTATTSVRPPVPYMTSVTTGFFKGDKAEAGTPRRMYKQFRTLEATASTLPLGLSKGLIRYLDKFPYGCTEQTVSKAFPAVVLMGHTEFGYAPGDVEKSLAEAMRILRYRQQEDGGFGYWGPGSNSMPYINIYALHYLTEAKEKGYPVAQDVFDKAFVYAKSTAGGTINDLDDARTKAYAIYILTRNGMVTTNYIDGIKKQLKDRYATTWRKDSTALYIAAAYKMLKQDAKAEDIISKFVFADVSIFDFNGFNDALMRDSRFMYIIARHFPEHMDYIKGDNLMRLVNTIMGNGFNTISSANAILALEAYAGTAGKYPAAKFSINEVDAAGKEKPFALPQVTFPSVNFSDNAARIRFASQSEFNIFYQVIQAGFDLAPPATVIKELLEVQREYRDAQDKTVTAAALGTELEVRLKIRSTSAGGHRNIAVVDLLPGGFEVVTESIRGEKKGGFEADYVDVREDRVVIFGSVTDSVSEFVYRIKATNKGEYAVPPAFGESMYDRRVKARSLGGRITVNGR